MSRCTADGETCVSRHHPLKSIEHHGTMGVSFKICAPYEIILKLLMFVIASEKWLTYFLYIYKNYIFSYISYITNFISYIKCITFRYHKFPNPGRNYQQISIFISIWTERTLTQRCRSISQFVRYCLKNVGNF